MAERTAEQVRTRLKNQLIVYDPTFEDPNEQFRQIVGGALGSRRMTREEAAQAAGVPVEQLTKLEPELDLGGNERTALYQQYITPGRGTGFFSSLLGGVGGVIGGLTDTVVDPVANALNVHPDAIKAAAALVGMYYAGGGTFFDTATNAIVPEATAVELIAPQLGAETLGAAAAAPAAGAGLSAAEIAALGAEGLAVPAATAPVATAFPVPMPGTASPLNMMAFPGDIIDGSLGQAYNALGVGAAAPASNVGSMLAGYGGAGDVFNPLTGAVIPGADAATGLASAGVGLAGYGGAGDVINPLTGAIIPGADAATGLTGAGLVGYGGAGDVLDPITGTVIPGNSLPTLAPGAVAPVSAVGPTAMSGYGGAGDVLNPVTGAVIPGAGAAALTGAGLAGAAGAAGAGALGANALVPLALAGTGVLGAVTAQSAAETQADAARYAADKAYQVYQEQKALQEPFRTAGISAQNQLLTLLGLPGGTQGAEFGRYARPFGMQDFQADPGYAFRLSEGLKALEASRAAKSGLLSGSAIKAGMRYGQEMGLQEYNNAFQRAQIERANRLQPLGSLAGLGQAAASNQGTAAGQYGTNVGNLATSGAAAQAAGQVGMANALTGSLNTYLNYSANQNLVNALQDAAARRASMYGPF